MLRYSEFSVKQFSNTIDHVRIISMDIGSPFESKSSGITVHDSIIPLLPVSQRKLASFIASGAIAKCRLNLYAYLSNLTAEGVFS